MMELKVFTLCLSILCVSVLSGQKQIMWFDAGLKVQSGVSGFYNQAIANSDAVDYAVGNSYSFGGKFGINFGYSGLAIDLMYGQTTGEFDHQDFAGTTELTIKNTDLYLLFRDARQRGFFEIGPKFSFLRNASSTLTSADRGNGTSDVTDQYQNGIAGVLAFGANLLGNDGRFTGQLGLRFEYGFTDIVSPIGKEAFAPVGNESIYNEGYKGTHPLFVGVVFELNWGIGYYGKTKCGGKTKFFMF